MAGRTFTQAASLSCTSCRARLKADSESGRFVRTAITATGVSAVQERTSEATRVDRHGTGFPPPRGRGAGAAYAGVGVVGARVGPGLGVLRHRPDQGSALCPA